mmetsp:Transcript_71261/g.197889  ORF Transcript_71261/g.197889 Transcript_71261/m.197889 type:complete len:272 (+) Transcript_71261:250-1065(+)
MTWLTCRKLGPAVWVVPADIEAAVNILARHHASIPHSVLGKDGLHSVIGLVVRENGNLAHAGRLACRGRGPSVWIIPGNLKGTVAMVVGYHPRVPCSILVPLRLYSVTYPVLHEDFKLHHQLRRAQGPVGFSIRRVPLNFKRSIVVGCGEGARIPIPVLGEEGLYCVTNLVVHEEPLDLVPLARKENCLLVVVNAGVAPLDVHRAVRIDITDRACVPLAIFWEDRLHPITCGQATRIGTRTSARRISVRALCGRRTLRHGAQWYLRIGQAG